MYLKATFDRAGGYLLIYLFLPDFKCGGLPTSLLFSARFQMRGLPLTYPGAVRDAGTDFLGSPHHFILTSNESIGSPHWHCKWDMLCQFKC